MVRIMALQRRAAEAGSSTFTSNILRGWDDHEPRCPVIECPLTSLQHMPSRKLGILCCYIRLPVVHLPSRCGVDNWDRVAPGRPALLHQCRPRSCWLPLPGFPTPLRSAPGSGASGAALGSRARRFSNLRISGIYLPTQSPSQGFS